METQACIVTITMIAMAIIAFFSTVIMSIC
jgi:hypothetical protein